MSPGAAATPYAGIAGSKKSRRARPAFRQYGRTRAVAPARSRLAPRHSSQTPPQFLLELGRRRGPAAGQRTDHQPIRLAEFSQQGAGYMPQPASDAVAF